MKSAVWFSLLLAGLAYAAPSVPSAQKVKENITPPRGWVKGGPAPADAIIELRIALPQPNFVELERHLYEIRFVSCSAWKLFHLLT